MKKFLKILKTSLLAGALIVLPAWIAVLLVLKAVMNLEGFVKPISKQLPPSVDHPLLVAILVMVLICFLAGLAFRTVVGRRVERKVQKVVLEKVPGYRMLRNVADQIGDTEGSHGFKPALIEVEDALAPGFIVEEHAGGRCTVFLPSVPTPVAGTIYIIDVARVHPVNVSVAVMFQCVAKWGAGSGELLAALPENSLHGILQIQHKH